MLSQRQPGAGQPFARLPLLAARCVSIQSVPLRNDYICCD